MALPGNGSPNEDPNWVRLRFHKRGRMGGLEQGEGAGSWRVFLVVAVGEVVGGVGIAVVVRVARVVVVVGVEVGVVLW